MLKKLFQSLLIIATSLLICAVHAQGDDNNENKRKIYEQLVQSIQALEEKAQYSGDDPIIRERLGLPPKPSSFDEWVFQSEQKSIKVTESSVSEITKVDKDNESSSQVENKVESQNSLSTTGLNSAGFPYSKNEIYLASAINLFLILINFILYATVPFLRNLTITPPFDIGVRGEKSEAEKNVRFKRYTVEFLLLLCFLFMLGYYFFNLLIEGKSIPNEDFVYVLKKFTWQFGFTYVIYLIARYSFGISSRCPKCKISFAAIFHGTHDEPRSTFQKKQGNQLVTVEVGNKISEYSCRNCQHNWTKSEKYKKNIDSTFL
jgi:hypothetical protein